MALRDYVSSGKGYGVGKTRCGGICGGVCKKFCMQIQNLGSSEIKTIEGAKESYCPESGSENYEGQGASEYQAGGHGEQKKYVPQEAEPEGEQSVHREEIVKLQSIRSSQEEIQHMSPRRPMERIPFVGQKPKKKTTPAIDEILAALKKVQEE